VLLIRHLLRTAMDLARFAHQGGGRWSTLLVLVGAPIVVLLGVIKVAGLAALYPFL
jgi:hypothetical protein